MIPGKQRSKRIGEQYVARRVSMLRSPAYCVLSLSARRVLDRIEIEHMAHGGVENGKLPVTYEHFAEYGVHRHCIAAALRECIALGFIEITEPGQAGNAEFRRPALYRLTYLFTNRANPTDEWRRIQTDEDALTTAKAARNALAKKQKSTPVFCQVSPPESGGKEVQFPHPFSGGTASPPFSGDTSRYRDPATLQVLEGGQSSPSTSAAGPLKRACRQRRGEAVRS